MHSQMEPVFTAFTAHPFGFFFLGLPGRAADLAYFTYVFAYI